MINNRLHCILALLCSALLCVACTSETPPSNDATSNKPASDLISGKPQNVPVPGMVTMVDIGAHECVPCKMMAPIIQKTSREYEGRAAIVFIDVWQHQEQAKKFNIRSIPTQIFYDSEGNEQFRHVGFMGEEAIVAKLAELGVK